MLPRPPISTLFPYTTLFRSSLVWGSTSITLAARKRLAWRLPIFTVGTPKKGASINPLDELRRLFLAYPRSEEHTSELQSLTNLVCRLLLEKKKKKQIINIQT